MRLTGWSIEGFGIFHNSEVRELAPGLQVFVGPNEAGKTTLLAFLKGVLFGFPTRGKEQRYAPLAGGRHGGRVYLEHEGESYTIERFSGPRQSPTLTLPDASLGTEADLNRLLGGADGKLFSSVFAFGLDELRTFGSLEAEGIRDRIFSAGIAGAGVSAREVVSRLSSRTDELLRPKKKAIILNTCAELTELDRELKEAQREALAYPALLRQLEELKQKREQLGSKNIETKNELGRLELLTELWPTYAELSEAERELVELGQLPVIAEDAAAKKAALDESSKHLEHQIAELVSELEVCRRAVSERERADAEVFEALLPEIEELCSLLALQADRLGKRSSAEESLRTLEMELHSGISQLGGEWSTDRINSVDTALCVFDRVRSWQESLGEFPVKREALQSQLRQLEVRIEQYEAQLRELRASKEKLTALPPNLVEAREDALCAFESSTAEKRQLEAALLNRESLVLQLRQQHQASISVSPWAFPVSLLVMLVAFLSSIWHVLAGSVIFAGLFALVGVFVALFAAVLRRLQGSPLTSEHLRSRDDLKELENTILEERHRVSELTSNIAESAEVLQLNAEASSADLIALKRRVQSERALLDELERTQAELGKVDREIQDARTEQGALKRQLDQLAAQESLKRHGFNEWLSDSQLPQDLSPQAATDVLEHIRHLRNIYQRLAEAKDALSGLSFEIDEWEKCLRALGTKLGMELPSSGGERLLSYARVLGQEAQEYRKGKTELCSLRERTAELENKLVLCRDRLAKVESEKKRLYCALRAETEDEFYQVLALIKKASELEAQIKEKGAVIRAQLGADSSGEQRKEELSSGALEEWALKREQLQGIREELDVELESIREEIYALEHRLENQRDSAQVLELESKLESVREELREAVYEWKKFTLARTLVAKTLREYANERQPAVLAQASQFFHQVTGRYSKIAQDEQLQELSLIDRDGSRKAPEVLSRGTAEQLYLCLRLGLAEAYSEQTVGLPLVMDDVLVNFDPERSRAMAELIARVSENHQVVLFTCHPETGGLFKSILSETKVSFLG